jgi:hypothetical protein
MPGGALASKHGQQLLVAQRRRAFAQQLLARPVGFGDVAGCVLLMGIQAACRWVWMTVTAMMSKMPPVSVYLGSASSS